MRHPDRWVGCLCRRVMHVPVGFAPLPIIHNFEGKTCPHALPSSQCAPCVRSVLLSKNALRTAPTAFYRGLQCCARPAHNPCLLLCKRGQPGPLCLPKTGKRFRWAKRGVCRDPKQPVATRYACPGRAIQLQAPYLRWLHPVAQPQSHVSIHYPATKTSNTPPNPAGKTLL